jgi:hypothetical protein
MVHAFEADGRIDPGSATLPLLFLRKVNSTPNDDFEKVGDECAVIQAQLDL